MIITCPNCKKNFEVKDTLIPNKGRFLKCGSCSYKWFYEKTAITENKNLKKLEENKKELSKNIDVPSDVEKIIKDAEENSLTKKNKSNQKKTKANTVPLINILIVFVISIMALILIFDTFKLFFENIIPGFNFFLNNFYETIKDVYLFSKDLLNK